MEIDNIVNYFVDVYDEGMSVSLLQTVAPEENGGLGHKIQLKRMIDMDGYEYSAMSKTITLDSSYFMADMSVAKMAENLKEAIQVKIHKTHASLGSRLGWGSVNVVVGVIETSVGFIGIIVPEPGTTVAGAAVFTLGVNSITDGLTQLAGVNNGHGFNPLAAGATAIGGKIAVATGNDKAIGEAIARNTFVVSTLAIGTVGSIRILKVPNRQFLQAGVKGRPGGLTVGRVEMMYGSERAKDGMTIFSINNNSRQSILRFVTHDGQLMVNGRIVGVDRLLVHATSPKEILKGLIKLCVHGARAGF
ncbi:hypothetical protein [Roseibium sp. MMSF_3412]|uniref:hypothetical protein n=1 Tax=Roseibium sp. MMSF_3412 TaxID=3046712 RepID=UPI00273F2A88|nr:hypothetical protein [Roseibium sp. MMSF_3412]